MLESPRATLAASPLAQTFEQCACALQTGNPQLVLVLLRTLDRETLPPASARLYEHLSKRAQLLCDAMSLAAGSQEVQLLALDTHAPLPGVSIVSACMNRQGNLLKVLPSWLASGADEIIIVDWSSTEPLWPLLAPFDDPRLKLVRIEDEPRWILTHAFNVGLRLARHEVVFKLDADIEITPGFLAANRFGGGEFIRGFWKQAVEAGEPDQRYTNGSIGARKLDLRSVGYYNERILTYGWDDTDLYARLHGSAGLAGRLLAQGSLRHLPQDESQRLANQAVPADPVLGRFAPTEHENLVNKYHQLIELEWAPYWLQQDYALTIEGPRRMRGRRTTQPMPQSSLERGLARVLAMRQIASWMNDLPGLDWDTVRGLPLASLLAQAHESGQSTLFAEAVRRRRGIHFFSSEHPALQPALERTLTTLRQHRPELAEVLFVLADDSALPAGIGQPGLLRAPRTVVQALLEATGASARRDLHLLETALAEPDAGCACWVLSVDALVESAIAHGQRIALQLQPRYRAPLQPVPRTAFVSSVYDEPNLLRMLEYLACISLNLRVFERQLLMYEARNGLLQLAAQSLCRSMGLPPQALLLLPFDRRPTFHELFSTQGLFAPGTLLTVGNADVAFDASLEDLAGAARDDYVYVLSRWDIDEDRRGAHLIRLECGVPNVFSADAWIVRTPFEPDFRLDYPIGSFHCDSFINNQLSRSLRYRSANPCLDVHAFHLHDARFNSSAEKNLRDRQEIERRYGEERERNDGHDPAKGAPWSNLAFAHIASNAAFLINWHAKALVLDMTDAGLDLGSIVWLHLLYPLVKDEDQVLVVVRLRADDSRGPAGRLLAHYKQHFRAVKLVIENDDLAASDLPARPAILHRQVGVADLLATLADGGVRALAARAAAFVAWPEEPGIWQTRCEARTTMDTAGTLALLALVRQHAATEHTALQSFLQSLDPWNGGFRLLLPFMDDLAEPPPPAPALVGLRRPRVCFVTSLFRGGNLVPGYLENVAMAAHQADGEVVIVDANGSDCDTPAIEAFLSHEPQVRKRFRVVRPPSDPGLYACWRLGIELSDAPYVTNANLDDRRSPQHTARLTELLDAHPATAAACGSISAVRQRPQAGWFDLTPNEVWFYDLGAIEFGFEDLFVRQPDGSVRSKNILHCMPVWRRSLHEQHGFFDEERYGTSADWAFWLTCARAGARFRLEPRAFGRYYLNPDSHNRRHDADGAKERRIIADLIGVTQDRVVKQ